MNRVVLWSRIRPRRCTRGPGRRADPACEPRTALAGSRVAHDLHVLLRHRLLRESRGFEGLLLIPALAVLDDVSIAQAVKPRIIGGNLRTAHTASGDDPTDDDHAVTHVEIVARHEPVLLEVIQPLSPI